MMYNPYMNPYGTQQAFQNPYTSRLNALQGDFAPRQDILTVNGENGAKALQMPPNSRMLLLDENEPIVWLAQTDGAGYKTVTPYTITPYKQQPAPDLNTLEARIKRLEEIINEKPNLAGSKPKSGAGAGNAEQPDADASAVW